MDMSFALFTSPGTVVQDGEYGYQNLFDATVDALHTAVAKLRGGRVRVVVSETGWPTAGGVAASVENAAAKHSSAANRAHPVSMQMACGPRLPVELLHGEALQTSFAAAVLRGSARTAHASTGRQGQHSDPAVDGCYSAPIRLSREVQFKLGYPLLLSYGIQH
ncbi:hypothetical protein PVAP13_7KG114700 [Panicum virgatum]|uniref:Glucan endo-1,3-beta-D-glucosidase n=1 Tax=Panicum virgatum TaxID=38727 RepID=A0A8T0QGH1_PANVG|nr:hypothetical protein PVAP13_7KG114700 [Panicum virgatum]